MYDDHYGLSDRPFQLTPDPKFWFETASHRKAMAYLGYGLAQGEGFIVVTGDIGAGKTTLVGHLVGTLDPAALNIVRIVSTAIEADDLLRVVATQFGTDPAGLTKAQLLTVIERGLHAVARTGRRTLLIVDEAQALPVSALEELRMLSNFQAGGHALIQILLLGQPEFRDRLHGSDRLEQLRQRVIAIHHLEPMEEHEVADYIAHRLSVVGWQGRPDFAADAFEALYRGSDGVPRRLNLLAGRVMLHAALEDLTLIDARAVRRTLRDLHADLPLLSLTPPPAGREPEPEPKPEPQPEMVALASEPMIADPEPVIAKEPRRSFVPLSNRWLLVDPEPEADAPIEAELDEAAALDVDTTDGEDISEPVASEPDAEPVVVEAIGETAVSEPVCGPSEPVSESPAADPAPVPFAEDRLASLEARIEEQDAALRRVLTLLVDWVEAEKAAIPAPTPAPPPTADFIPIRPPAAWDDAA